MKKNWNRMGIAVILLSCIIAMSGCLDKKELVETTDAVQTITVGRPGLDIKIASIIIASELGYYMEEGVNVKFETISNLADGMTAVSQGKLDVLPFGVIPSCTFVSKGSDVVVFGGTISEGSEGVVLPENINKYNTVGDFRNKKIGCYRMETGHMVIKGFLRENGLDVNSDVEFVYLDSQQSIVEAVKKGEVDVGFVNSGYGYIAEKSDLAIAFHASDFSADFPCCRQTTNRSALTDKHEALLKFTIANLRAYHTLENDKKKSIDALVAYCGQDAQYVESVIYGSDTYDAAMKISLDPNKNKVCDFYEIMKNNGDIDADTKFKMEDHVDTSIYKEALEELIRKDKDSGFYVSLKNEFEKNNK